MRKSLPTGCRKNKKNPDWKCFNLLMEKFNVEDKIGYLFVLDITFDRRNAKEKTLMVNGIY